jgi:hypothetical protein
MMEKHRRLKKRVFEHYSNGPGVCKCCGETRFEFLCLDHINGGGRQHRKTFQGSVYYWIKKNNFPGGFRVLCHNCNMALGFFGYCPHQTLGECGNRSSNGSLKL